MRFIKEKSRRNLFALAGKLIFGLTIATSLPALAQDTSKKPRIGVIGAGNVGGGIGGLWVKAGHEVLFASRHPEELQGLVQGLGPKAHAGTPAEAAAFGDVLFLAVPYKAYPELAAEIGPGLQGKVVLDAGNAFKARDGEIYDEVEAKGIGPTSAKYLPGARVVRGFNAAPVRVFVENANRPAPRLAIPIAGDDPAAIETAKQLVSDAGFEPVVVGKLKDADKFAFTGPGSVLNLTATELKEKLGVAP